MMMPSEELPSNFYIASTNQYKDAIQGDQEELGLMFEEATV
jgi:hypothetical protein